jgi:hypothetical protein
MAVSSREAVQAAIDPAYGEDIAPDRVARMAVQYAPADVDLLEQRLARGLRHSFGYDLGVAAPRPAPAHAPVSETAHEPEALVA